MTPASAHLLVGSSLSAKHASFSIQWAEFVVCAGLNAAVAAKAFAASRVAITDIRADNFAVAEQVSRPPAMLGPAQAQDVGFRFLGLGFRVSVGCRGAEWRLRLCIHSARGGHCYCHVCSVRSLCTHETEPEDPPWPVGAGLISRVHGHTTCTDAA